APLPALHSFPTRRSSDLLTDSARIGAVDAIVRSVAEPYTGDEEISRFAAGLRRQLAAMAEAKALLDKRDFAGTLAACAQHQGHRSEEHTSELQSLRHLVC